MSYHRATDLFDAIGLAPALPGAACAGRSELFDERADHEDGNDAEYRHQAAQRLCAKCPALAGCSEWFTGLPQAKRPPGVVAGVVNVKSIGRRQGYTLS